MLRSALHIPVGILHNFIKAINRPSVIMSFYPARVSTCAKGQVNWGGIEWMYSNHKTRTNVINAYFALQDPQLLTQREK